MPANKTKSASKTKSDVEREMAEMPVVRVRAPTRKAAKELIREQLADDEVLVGPTLHRVRDSKEGEVTYEYEGMIRPRKRPGSGE